MTVLTEAERLDWLCLTRCEGVGPVTFRQLIQRFGSAGKALSALPDLAKRGGRRRPIKIATRQQGSDELAAIARLGARLIARGEADFPTALAEAEDGPPILVVLGRAELLRNRAIGIVGARNASANGRKIAHDMARGLAEAGLTVASGLARGIDTAAHLGALGVGAKGGGTIAVVAGGVDVLYPPENGALFERIKAEGLVVSENPPGTEARHFPRRNRIVSGLSLGVVVIEAALRSGSLLTARFALDQDREVMAVPGSPLDPRCRGANRLIREGARLVEDHGQVLEAISLEASLATRRRPEFMPEPQAIEIADESETGRNRAEILARLGPSPVEVDELLRQCHCSAPVLGMVLLELDLAGRLERHPGNRVSLLAGTD